MSLESEKCHHPGYPLLVGQSRILSVTSQGSDAQEDEKEQEQEEQWVSGNPPAEEGVGRQGNLGTRGLGARGAVISTATVPAEPMNLSTYTHLSK